MESEVSIEPLTRGDLPEVAAIHVRVWQTAYAGLMPQIYLDDLDPAERLKKWQDIFDNSEEGSRSSTLVAKAGDKRIGFLSYGTARDANREGWAEIYAIYVLQEYQRRGIGYKLFCAAQEILVRQGFDKAYLWVLEKNERALDIYRRWLGVVDTNSVKSTVIASQPLKEVSVSFRLAPNP